MPKQKSLKQSKQSKGCSCFFCSAKRRDVLQRQSYKEQFDKLSNPENETSTIQHHFTIRQRISLLLKFFDNGTLSVGCPSGFQRFFDISKTLFYELKNESALPLFSLWEKVDEKVHPKNNHDSLKYENNHPDFLPLLRQFVDEHTISDPNNPLEKKLSPELNSWHRFYHSFRGFLQIQRKNSKDSSTSASDPGPSWSVFQRIQKEHLHDVSPMQHSADACDTCTRIINEIQNNDKSIGKFENNDELGSNEKIIHELRQKNQELEQELHLHNEHARCEWKHYVGCVENAKVDWLKRREKIPIGADVRTTEAEVHLAIDAQKVQKFPHFSVQPQASSTYFMNKAKIYHMAVIDEGADENYGLVWGDEGGPACGDHLISIIWLWVSNFLRGEKRLRLTFDNCKVNKNWMVWNFFFLDFFPVTIFFLFFPACQVLAFCVLLVQEEVFEQVNIDYLIAGHTRFHPDRYFAWLTNVLEKCDFFSLEDFVESIEKNARDKAPHETIMTEFESWTESLKETFNKVKNISTFQTFCIKKSEKNLVTISASEGHRPTDKLRSIEIAHDGIQLRIKKGLLKVPPPRPKNEIPKSTIEDLKTMEKFVFFGKQIKI